MDDKKDYFQNLLQEPAPAYLTSVEGRTGKKQGEYTISDYLALPEDERWELIDGHLYRMAAPATDHQVLLGELYYRIRNCIESCGEDCLILAAPTDVQLDMDDRTIVEPDLIVLCDLKKLQKKRIAGAPDLLVEILSPSSRSRDMILKNRKYRKAGVREYWIVDPEEKCVIVSIFEKEMEEFTSRIYDFSSEIPVGISEGRCRIDFAGIAGKLKGLYP